MLHHDRDRRTVSNGCVPGCDTFLGDGWCKIAWCKDEAPLTAAVFGIAQLEECIFDVLGGCSGNEGVIVEASFLELLAEVFEESGPFGIGDCDGLASGPKDYQTTEARICKMDGMFCLSLQVKRRNTGGIVEGWVGDKECRDWGIDTGRWRICHYRICLVKWKSECEAMRALYPLHRLPNIDAITLIDFGGGTDFGDTQ